MVKKNCWNCRYSWPVPLLSAPYECLLSKRYVSYKDSHKQCKFWKKNFPVQKITDEEFDNRFIEDERE